MAIATKGKRLCELHHRAAQEKVEHLEQGKQLKLLPQKKKKRGRQQTRPSHGQVTKARTIEPGTGRTDPQ